MAKVELDLAELKQYESKIETLEKEKQSLIENQKQVVIYHKHFNGSLKVNKVKSKDFSNTLEIMGVRHTGNFGMSNDYFTDHVTFDTLMDRGLVEIDVTEDTNRTTKDYKNLSEVISEIRAEEEQKVQEKLQYNINRANKIEVESETLVQDHSKEIIRLNKKNSEKIEKLNEEFQTKTNDMLEKHKEELVILKSDFENKIKIHIDNYNNLSDEFSKYKGDEKQMSLEEQISKLTELLNKKDGELAKFKSKNLISRIFNK